MARPTEVFARAIDFSAVQKKLRCLAQRRKGVQGPVEDLASDVSSEVKPGQLPCGVERISHSPNCFRVLCISAKTHGVSGRGLLEDASAE